MSGPPDGDGNYAYCNLRWTGNANQWQQAWVSCQFGQWNSQNLDGVHLKWNKYPSGVDYWWMGDDGDSIGGMDWSVPSAGKFRAHMDWPGAFGPRSLNHSSPGWCIDQVSYPGNEPMQACDATDALVNAEQGSDYPPYPSDYWPGGSPGDVADVADPASVCARTITLSGTTGAVSFRTGNTLDENATDTYSWDFGDSVGTSTGRNPSYFYDLLEMPEGGWTAEVELTRTADAGHTFADYTTEKSVTCALRVDLLNPDQSDPEDPDSMTEEDSDCPSGWGWLNPLALVRILKCLFVPTSDLSDSWSDMTSAASTSYPLGPLLYGADLMADAYGQFQDGLTDPNTYDCNWGPELGINASDEFGPVNEGQGVDITLLNNCPDEEVPDYLVGVRDTSFMVSTVLMVIGFAYVCLRLFGVSIGSGGKGGDDDGD